MVDTSITSTLTGAVFTDDTTLSGTWTTEYNAAANSVAITNCSFTATGAGGNVTTFMNAYALLHGEGASGSACGMTFSSSGGTYNSLYIAWNSENPTLLAPGDASRYTSIKIGSGGSAIRLHSAGVVTEATPCFAAGTRILVERGSIAVEALIVGDRAVLDNGTTAPITWVGSRMLNLVRHPRPETVQPIRIVAGALAPGVPAHDLLLSPGHALFLDGHLVPAKALLNGWSITQLNLASITYYHVALPAHAVLVAEGAPAESSLARAGHGLFNSAGAGAVLQPALAQRVRESGGCAPFAEVGEVVEQIRARILWRADIESTCEAELTIEYADGLATIQSRTAIPGEVWFDPRDRRVLGVEIAPLHVPGQAAALDHPDLATDWYDVEAEEY